ncbi:MAG: hypothetical protein DCC49_13460 [Acidobacteria bacterium]|nr:MAG: hypothetical protein DCC49_13460 [Acidobacteriota bacterium]
MAIFWLGRAYCNTGELILRLVHRVDLGGQFDASGSIILFAVGIIALVLGYLGGSRDPRKVGWTRHFLLLAEGALLVSSLVAARLFVSSCFQPGLIR